MIILGLDPALSATGYSVIQKNGQDLSLLDSGVIRTKSKDLLSCRIKSIADRIENIINIYHPEHAVLEECFLGQNVKTALLLGEVRGALLFILKSANIAIYEYSARVVKLAIVGYGAASKTQVQFMINNILHLPPHSFSYDESDAMAVTICHIHHNQFQQEKRV
ncbi:MAG: crossover junction endodeoxyribonuclease RuvC [bacterium]